MGAGVDGTVAAGDEIGVDVAVAGTVALGAKVALEAAISVGVLVAGCAQPVRRMASQRVSKVFVFI
jgi:hypothetical protein